MKDHSVLKKQASQCLFILSLALLFLFIKGFQFGGGNHVAFVQAIRKLARPELYPHDWLIGNLIPYHYGFNLLYARLMRYVDLPRLFLISSLIAAIFYVVGFCKISRTLFKTDGPFYLLYALLMIWPTHGIEINALFPNNGFEGPFLSTSLAVLSIAYFFEAKTAVAFFLAGLATVFQEQIGFNLFLIESLGLIYEHRKDLRRIGKDLGLPVLAYLAIAGYPLYSALKMVNATSVSGPGNFYIDFLRFRNPHHYFLSSIPGRVGWFALLCLLGLAGYIKKQKGDSDRRAAVFIAIIFFGILLQFFFIEIIPVGLFAKPLFFRMSVFVTLFVFQYMAFDLSSLMNDRPLSFFVFFLTLAIVFCQNPPAALLLMALLYLVRMARRRFPKSPWNELILLTGLCSAGFIAYLSLRYRVKLFSEQGLDFNFLGLVLAGLTGSLLFLVMRRPRQENKGGRAFVVPLLVLIVLTLGIHLDKGFFYNVKLEWTPKNDWQKLCVWIKENTPRDALFIAPPYLSGFELYAERNLLVDFKSNPWLEKGILEWKRRLEGLTKTNDLFRLPMKGFAAQDYLKERYDSLSGEDVIRLAGLYGARFIIFPKPKTLPFFVLYQNTHYVLFQLEPIPSSLP